MGALDNARYEAFAQGLAKGLSQRKAYQEAFPRSQRWKDSTVDVKACNLAKEGKISVRVKELLSAASDDAIMTITERKKWLSDVVRNDCEERKERIKALDILNKMDGAYVEKVELNGRVNNPFEGLTTDELKKLIGDG